jgi:hypothetical protein
MILILRPRNKSLTFPARTKVRDNNSIKRTSPMLKPTILATKRKASNMVTHTARRDRPTTTPSLPTRI